MTVKDELLALLMQQHHTTLSGQQIANKLKVSRNAVWKAVEQLRQAGYIIESVPRVGYTLHQATTALDRGQIQHQLADFWRDLHIEIHDSVTSTNDLAKQFAIDSPNQSGVFIATHQSKGRGRRGRQFHSELAHGLYFTLVFRPEALPLSDIPQYTLVAASAMVHAIETLTDRSIAIKWINDLFANGKKIGGILCEAVTDLETQEVSAVLVGIGLNLAGSFAQASEETRQVAGTLFGETLPPNFNPNTLLRCFLNQFAIYHRSFPQKIHLPYYESHLLGVGKYVTYQQQQTVCAGIIEGINQDGHLLVRHEDGTVATLFGNDIHFSSQQFI
ncbi:biotin--[acetyl-CoA-carboxylase] ligase [Aerococcaceae bacterium NML191292]|nr:biotin--[acetyl-CoA-carboxylase] ligase [Aerococcaceae bacterium NML191292]